MLFSSLSEKRGVDPLENPQNSLTGDGLSEYISGSRAGVTEATAMRLSAVYSCLYVLSSSVAQLPLHVLRRTGDAISKGSDHPAFYVLRDEPNAWQSSYDWRETGQLHVSGWGNSLTQIVRNRRGEVVELVQHKPWSSSLVERAGRWIYACAGEGGKGLAVSPEDMIHVRALGSDGRWGVSPIRQHAETIGLGLDAQSYGRGFFSSGGRPTAVLTPKGVVSGDGWKSLKEMWSSVKRELRSDGSKTLLLPGDVEYRPMTVPPEDAQFVESRKLTRSEVAGIFNVPAHMINDLEKATFSNISEQAIQFVRHTVMPWIVKWEQEINRKLFTVSERRAGYYVKFNLGALLRGTQKERAEFYHYAITDGWMTRNEARVFEDMNPEKGLDDFLVSVNAVHSLGDKSGDNADT